MAHRSGKQEILARRQQERLHRLLDTKMRTKGVDKAALDRTVEEHRRQQEAERDAKRREGV